MLTLDVWRMVRTESLRVSRRMRRLVLFTMIVLASGCDGLGAGPCVHTFEDPVLRITQARDRASDAALPEVAITRVRILGYVQTPQLLTAVSERVVMRGDTLVCSIP